MELDFSMAFDVLFLAIHDGHDDVVKAIGKMASMQQVHLVLGLTSICVGQLRTTAGMIHLTPEEVLEQLVKELPHGRYQHP